MAKSDVKTCKVRRNGAWTTRDTEELVVGDLIELNTGETIPADCLVLEADDLSCSEAALTGEPDGLPKEPAHDGNWNTHPDPFLLQSALVEKGTATAIVLAVGDNTN